MVTREDYKTYLMERVFDVEKYGQFNLMFEFFDWLNAKKTMKIGLLERSYIYDGRSIFAPMLDNHKVHVIDYRPKTASQRAGFQSGWLTGIDMDLPRSNSVIEDLGHSFEIKLSAPDFDCFLVPNVLHHCRDFSLLMDLVKSAVPNINQVHIFDSYIREQHQYPDDFCRFTVAGLEAIFQKLGFYLKESNEYGNVFDGILYLIAQSEAVLSANAELKELKILLDEAACMLGSFANNPNYRNLGRPHASFASSYTASFFSNV